MPCYRTGRGRGTLMVEMFRRGHDISARDLDLTKCRWGSVSYKFVVKVIKLHPKYAIICFFVPLRARWCQQHSAHRHKLTELACCRLERTTRRTKHTPSVSSSHPTPENKNKAKTKSTLGDIRTVTFSQSSRHVYPIQGCRRPRHPSIQTCPRDSAI